MCFDRILKWTPSQTIGKQFVFFCIKEHGYTGKNHSISGYHHDLHTNAFTHRHAWLWLNLLSFFMMSCFNDNTPGSLSRQNGFFKDIPTMKNAIHWMGLEKNPLRLGNGDFWHNVLEEVRLLMVPNTTLDRTLVSNDRFSNKLFCFSLHVFGKELTSLVALYWVTQLCFNP